MTDVEQVREALRANNCEGYPDGCKKCGDVLCGARMAHKALPLLEGKVLVDAIPLADKENRSHGWTVDYDSINAITNQARVVNEDIGMEEVEAVIMAMTDLGHAYLTAAKEE